MVGRSRILLQRENKERKCNLTGDLGSIKLFFFFFFKIRAIGTSVVVQWRRLYAPKTGDPGLITGQGTRSHMPELRCS